MTGKKQQTINDILSNKKLRDQNAYVEVINQDVLETVQWVPGCLSVTAVGAWGGGGVEASQGCSLQIGLATGPGSEAQEQAEMGRGGWGEGRFLGA